MESVQYISFLRFSVQLILSEAVFLIGRERQTKILLRLVLSAAGYLLAGSTWYFLLHSINGSHPALNVCFYLGLWLITMLAMRACFDLESVEILFAGTGGYATEHIAFALSRIIQYVTGLSADAIGPAADYLFFRFLPYVVVAAAMYLFVIRRNHANEEFDPKDFRLVYAATFVLVFAIVLSVCYSTRSIAGEPDVINSVICPVYSALSCVIVILMEYDWFRENRLSREKASMEQMLQVASAQQKSSKEAIDIINMKCHDLKHQIRALGTMNNEVERSEYLEELQNALSIYGATYHTGCEALDYVLQEKALLAGQHGVQFSCMADGASIAFLSPADIYALMGNALDNALESVLREAKDQRIISLNISPHGQMVILHLENRCSRPLEFQDGLPITDKADKNYHGFGVQSIRYIVQKYHGEVYMRTQNGMFLLDILFQRSATSVS